MLLVVDTETHFIRPGRLVPRLVCMSIVSPGKPTDEMRRLIGDHSYFKQKKKYWEALVDRQTAIRIFVRYIHDRSAHFVAHNAGFDMAVLAEAARCLPAVFAAYDQGRISCTWVRERLWAIAKGYLTYDPRLRMKEARHSLAQCVKARFGEVVEKGEDTYRLRYGELEDIPIFRWPKEALRYAVDDSVWCYKVFQDQGAEEIIADNGGPIVHADGRLCDEVPQFAAAFALHLMSAWGLRTDPERVPAFVEDVNRMVAKGEKVAKKLGFLRSDGSVCQKILHAHVTRAYKGKPPRTPTGRVSAGAEVLLESGDPDLIAYAESAFARKLQSQYVKIAMQGITCPINPSFNVLVATGRTSCRKPNMQNPPRGGVFRNCFIPRPGYIYCSVDYDTIEMKTLAWVCETQFGYSAMADAIRDGKDLHLDFAASLMGVSYEEALRRYKADDEDVEFHRQLAKVANFGIPGGLGAKGFKSYAKGYGVEISLSKAKELRADFLEKWPEMNKYFAWLKRATMHGKFTLKQHSGRQRGATGYCPGCNSYFQGLAADGAKAALWAVTKACYTDPTSPLFGARPVIFLHDEIICEIPEEQASEGAKEMSRLMIEAMERYIPGLPVTAAPALMRRWYKGADPVYGENGVLLPWTPKKRKEVAVAA